jgi:hypothetical protein
LVGIRTPAGLTHPFFCPRISRIYRMGIRSHPAGRREDTNDRALHEKLNKLFFKIIFGHPHSVFLNADCADFR